MWAILKSNLQSENFPYCRIGALPMEKTLAKRSSVSASNFFEIL